MKNILIIAVVQTVLVVASVVGTWFMFLKTQPSSAVEVVAEDETPTAKVVKADPVYVSMDPAFIVNLQDRGKMRFLQLQLEVMTRDTDVPDKLELYNTRIRNDLILLFGALTMDDIRQTEGKTGIQEGARNAINAILAEESDLKDAVEAVYFTKFVVQ